jgi:Outer membrane lipoprotein-sorting protein
MKIKKLETLSITVLLVLAGFISLSYPGGLDYDKILARSDRARGNLAGIQWKIKIASRENGRSQHRELRLKARGVNSLAEFTAPAKVKGRKLLMRDRNMWFIKPGLRKPVPISPRQKLMGGASNGDIASTNYAGDYKIAAASEEEANGEACYLFDLEALDHKVTYDKIRYWISKKRLVGVKAEFYTVSGKLFKTATFEYDNWISVNEKAFPFVSKMEITDTLIRQNVTTLYYSNVRVKPVPDAVFNLNLLVR